MRAVRLDELRTDAATGRVYVRYAPGEHDALPAKARMTMEFMSVREYEAWRDESVSDETLLRRLMLRHLGRPQNAVSEIERADGQRG